MNLATIERALPANDQPLKLIDALKILQSAPGPEARELNVYFVCGFTPLHLKTFLGAHLQLLCPDRRIEIETGLYGDLRGNLERAGRSAADAVALILEWSDLDPRLGIRSVGRAPAGHDDVRDSVRAQIERIQEIIGRDLTQTNIAISLPSLPPRAITTHAGWQSCALDAALSKCIADFAVWAAEQRNVRLLSAHRLNELSPSNARWDARAELSNGFPYQLAHAAVLGDLLSRLIQPPQPKKGLITDLDDTLWLGIVGEVGAQGVSWCLDKHSHAHALYQEQLSALARAGVLIAVASKNDPGIVREAFERSDLLVSSEQMFPLEVTWGAKSAAVRRILKAWNVAADSVVFVDDSPMELAEVQAAFPGIECIRFPKNDPPAFMTLLERLRDLFGKNHALEEDGLRLASLRRQAEIGEVFGTESGKEFLENSQAELTFSIVEDSSDSRPLELVNKTNQFNLNGRRYTESEWRAYLNDPNSHVLVVSYKDKYGLLGKIAVLGARTDGDQLIVDTWVMSCRAFSRRIEHQCLLQLFRRFGMDEIHFDFQSTPRNLPLQEFFAGLRSATTAGRFSLTYAEFQKQCPPLFHTIEDANNE